jgi:hypothetical protein
MASNIPNDNITMPASWRSKVPVLFGVGATGLLVSVGLFVAGSGKESSAISAFAHSYLANYMFCLSICLGALFFVLVQHLTRAAWSSSIRRLAELLAFTIPMWAVFFLPILGTVLMKQDYLYAWATGSKELPQLIQDKFVFLNPGFFSIRAVVYFAIFIVCARVYFLMSRKQDESGDTEITLKLQRWAGPWIMLFALALNFAAFDWMMSTDAAWFSTIYGVYLFAGGMLSFFATTIFLCRSLQKSGRLEKLVTTEHFHDMSKFQFGFIVFWGYIAFSQFLLYWYGNIPEETLWYKHRMEHNWQYLGLLLIVFHFAIPFLGTVSRHVRRNRSLMGFWAAFILVVHWLDMMFLIMPNVKDSSFEPMLILGHLTCWIGMVSLFAGVFLMRVGETPLVAVKDPWLPEALAYQVGP